MNTFLLNVFRMVFVSLFLVASQAVSLAQESSKGHSHENAEMHGGAVAMSRSYHFEVVFKQDAINVYLYDGAQKPLIAEGVEGEVTLKSRAGGAKILPLKVVSMHEEMGGSEHEKMEHGHGGEKMHAEQEEDHHMSMSMDFLQAKIDLSKVKAGSMKAVFSLKGLPNEKETSATFTETFNGFGGDKEESHHGKMETHKH